MFFSQLCSLTNSRIKHRWDRPTHYPRRGGYWAAESCDQCCVVHQHHQQSFPFFFCSACVFSSSSRQWRAVCSRFPDWKLWVRNHVASPQPLCECVHVLLFLFPCVWVCFSLISTGVFVRRESVFFSQYPHLCSQKCCLESCSSRAGLQTGAWVGGSICVCFQTSHRHWDITALWLICIRRHQNIVAVVFWGGYFYLTLGQAAAEYF